MARYIPNPNIPRVIHKRRPLFQRNPLHRNPPRIDHTGLSIIPILQVIIENANRIRYPFLVCKVPHKSRKKSKFFAKIVFLVVEICKVIDKGIHLAEGKEKI